MRQLLIALKAALVAELSWVRDSDIFLTVNPDLIPESAKLPCVGIKDGKTLISELAGDTLEKTLPVEIYLYDKVVPGDACILAFFEKGEDIGAAVTEDNLSGYVREVSPISETPSALMYSKKGLVVRKGFFFEYEKQEE